MDTEAAIASRTHACTDSIADQLVEEEDNEVLDPRVQRELDLLNVASSEINQLENELDEARSKYRSIVSETSQRMEVIAHDQKRCIQKSREYYKLLNDAKLAQGEALKAARQFQSATGVYSAAKETMALAERSLQEGADSATAQLTSAWQDMLNNAVTKVTEAEKDKAACEKEHKKRAAKFSEIETRKHLLEKKFSRSIKKAKPYFELKMEMDIKLMQQKQNVIDLQAAIKANKVKYKAALRRLEKISEEIHQLRNERLWSQVPRMPGVGAETDSITSGLSELALDSYDIKESVDSCSVDGESMTDGSYSDGISLTISAEYPPNSVQIDADDLPINVTIGADDPPINVTVDADDPSIKVQKSADDPLDGESVNVEPVFESTEAGENVVKATAEENQESEDEVFEDAETGPEISADTTAVHDTTVTSSSEYALGAANKDYEEEHCKDSVSSIDTTLQVEHNEDNIEKNPESLVAAKGNHDMNEAISESIGAELKENEKTTDDQTLEQYANVNMSNVERPSLSGEEE